MSGAVELTGERARAIAARIRAVFKEHGVSLCSTVLGQVLDDLEWLGRRVGVVFEPGGPFQEDRERALKAVAVLVLFPNPRAKHGKKPLSVSLMRPDEGGGFKLIPMDQVPRRLLSVSEPLLDPSRVPPNEDELARDWHKRYLKVTNQTGVSVLSLLGRVRNQVLVLVHRDISNRATEVVQAKASELLS